MTEAETITLCPGMPTCIDDRWAPCPFCLRLSTDMKPEEALAAFDRHVKGN